MNTWEEDPKKELIKSMNKMISYNPETLIPKFHITTFMTALREHGRRPGFGLGDMAVSLAHEHGILSISPKGNYSISGKLPGANFNPIIGNMVYYFVTAKHAEEYAKYAKMVNNVSIAKTEVYSLSHPYHPGALNDEDWRDIRFKKEFDKDISLLVQMEGEKVLSRDNGFRVVKSLRPTTNFSCFNPHVDSKMMYFTYKEDADNFMKSFKPSGAKLEVVGP
ncbi:hypothetical protein KW787_02015 [Candidatus Pacearchaeota archaeon]|nr:hypothetical protein [Candidatus Pacearchaeota archaeon]